MTVSPSVLIVDDEKSFRVVLQAALVNEGYDVRAAASASEARAEWRRSPPDLIILDRNLPDADGVELLQEIRQDAEERNVDVVVLVVTAYADVENAVMALKRGADDYVTKPAQLSDLVVKLEKALERRRLQRRVRALRHKEEDVVTLLRASKSPPMHRVLDMAEKVAASPDTPVLLQGESGAGKDMVARFIHALTPGRSESALVELNCAAIAEDLAESELFGHERGAFTDAKTAKRGVLELSHESTLFLDEIGDLGAKVQAKLLRVLETMRFRRVGGTRDLHVDVRILSATNRDLARDVEAGRFRLDLFHRLDVFHLTVPALRERSEDIVPLAEHFMWRIARRLGKPLDGLASDAQESLRAYAFPGNVRELRNLIERAVILESGPALSARSLVLGPASRGAVSAFFSIEPDADGAPPTLREVEREYLARVLDYAQGNKTRAARVLGITFPTINKKIADYGIKLG